MAEVVCCTCKRQTYTADGYHKEMGTEFRSPKDLSVGQGEVLSSFLVF